MNWKPAQGGHQAFPGGPVRPLSRPFPPFGQRALSAHLGHSGCGGGYPQRGRGKPSALESAEGKDDPIDELMRIVGEREPEHPQRQDKVLTFPSRRRGH